MNFDPSQFTYVLVSSTTHGNRLPSEARDYVGEHEQSGVAFDSPLPVPEPSSIILGEKSAVLFDADRAETVFQCWRDAVNDLNGHLIAMAVMQKHCHFVAAFPGKVQKEELLHFFKDGVSLVLNQKYGEQKWWTDSGSVRFCFDDHAFHARIEYIKNQHNVLVLWVNPDFE